MPAKHRGAHHRGSYQVRARHVREQALANPATQCWRCGRTAAEHGRRWHAGHLRDGDPNSPLLPECEPCNTSAGARLGNQLRRSSQFRTSRRW